MDGRFVIRFRLGPLPVAIEPSFWLGAVVLGFNGPESLGPTLLVWVAVVLFSVLAHELGHALCALAFGVRSRIRLHLWGGLTAPERPLTRWREILVSISGPAAGLALGALCYLLGSAFLTQESPRLWRLAALLAVEVNMYWGFLNLMPILPLDGGHIMLGILGPRRQRWALAIGGGTSALAALAFGARQSGLQPILLFGFLAFWNIQAFFASRHPRRGQSEGITLDEALLRGWAALSSGREEEADRLARLVLEHAPDPVNRNRARDLLAWSALASADARGALRTLERSEPPDAARALSFAMVLDAIGEPAQALPHALRAVEVEPSETSANLAVRLLLSQGDTDRAAQLAQSFAWQRPAARESALGEVAFAQKSFGAAAGHFGAAFEAGHLPGDAYNAACSHARAGERAQAREWVQRAVDAGFDDLEQLLADPDLSALKDDPVIRALAEHRPQRQGA